MIFILIAMHIGNLVSVFCHIGMWPLSNSPRQQVTKPGRNQWTNWMCENTWEHLAVSFSPCALACVLTYGSVAKTKCSCPVRQQHNIKTMKEAMWNNTSPSISYVKCETLLCRAFQYCILISNHSVVSNVRNVEMLYTLYKKFFMYTIAR